ncbi:MAG: hypothetical protein U9P80_10385 [Thermodesulfobacteriota bacterium]|nr:hypothetical protein [Thermodesulfobacteriota bacterium]
MSLDPKKDRSLFRLLSDTAHRAGIELIEDRINRKGGVARVDEKIIVLYDTNAPWKEKNRLILDAISQAEPDTIYLPPVVRTLIDDLKIAPAQGKE